MTDKNANTEIRKEFCPNCEKDTECIHAAELYECQECGDDFAKYIVPRTAPCTAVNEPSNSDVSMTQDVLTDIKTPQSVEIEELETVVEHLQIRLSEWRGVAMLLVDELNEAKSKQLPTSWEDASVASPAYIAYRNLVDVEDDWAGNRPCRRSGDTLLEVRKEDE